MPESPRHLVTVSFHVAILTNGCSQYASNVLRYARLFGNTNYHRYNLATFRSEGEGAGKHLYILLLNVLIK